MTIDQYLEKLNSRFKTGISTEHSYRGDLQHYLETLLPDVFITNEPSRIACGAPDYILTKNSIPIGYIEAKDLGYDLSNKNYKEQFERYTSSLSNLIITNYIDFWFYKDGNKVSGISIAEISNQKLISNPAKFQEFQDLLRDFSHTVTQSITSSEKLAKMMASKARLLANVIENALNQDEGESEGLFREANSSLRDQLLAFKQVLIHDITPKQFADVYAQTIAYGMFAARLHDSSLDNFSRVEAANLIPKSNPFLRKLFQYIAGYDLDERIKWIVDALADIFRATNVAALLKDFGKPTRQQDPIIHFYETFLAEYDPKLRKSRGVWYTPQPVVNFIVRAVDDILKDEFGLKEGLADTSKTKIKVNVQSNKKKQETQEVEVHKVQILDPATGTGTFLAEIIKHIYKKFEGQQGIWSRYVDDHLIPRLNGFEILMASYAMAHLKLDLLLTETGYKPTKDQRLKVFLTNSLEEHHPDTGTLFASWLSSESNEANSIKRDTPVMVVLGNPPYAVSSTNKGEWIQNLIADYKKDLNERKINLDDDYIKFIRYGQHYIDKNGSGILAYISNNSFIDGITHRQMRKHLLESFDKIYILDLHGNAKRKETCSDGSPDQNVFDIMQGVSINIFVKTGKKKKNELGQVIHSDLQGIREYKYKTLNENTFKSIQWKRLEYTKPNLFLVPKNFDEILNYEKGFKIDQIYLNNNTGIQTKRDALVYSFTKEILSNILKNIIDLSNQEIKTKYDLPEDGRDWTIDFARKDIAKKDGEIVNVLYHPFDIRISYFTGRSKGFMAYPRSPLSKNCIKENISLLAIRNTRTNNINNYFIANELVDKDGVSSLDNCKFFPLYLYSDKNGQQSIKESAERTPNLNTEIVKQIEEKLGLTFINEKETAKNTFAPIDILDYLYAVLHSPSYREKYKEFLKIDFPRVPYPKDQDTFWNLVKLGGELRKIHLLESPIVEKYITSYPIDGNNQVDKIKYENNKVWINESQYFDKVPQVSWEFYIGGYQPAQKWLKDRKGRTLSYEDILHYQKIIVALSETDRIMNEIDLINFE
ncbi:MAG: N-6 DNA methylase [Saprospiraceae bacterium]|nr:N-6 DNA methylase [Saprospiraceae bacterium]